MKKTLKKITTFICIMMVIVGYMGRNTIISDAAINANSKVILFEPFTDEKNKEKRINSISADLKEFYPKLTNIKGKNANHITKLYDNASKNDIVIFFTHGGVTKIKQNNKKHIESGISVYENKKECSILESEIGNLKVKKGSIYIIAACKVSSQNENFAKKLIKNGAKAVYTYKDSTTPENAKKQVKELLKNLRNGKTTPEDAYKKAKKKVWGGNGLVLTTK